MFIDFQFGNFRSFRDIQRLSLLAASKRNNDGGLDESSVVKMAGLRFLSTKVVYGKNAGGKSNLCMAIGAFRRVVIRSVAEERLPERIWHERYLLTSGAVEDPVFFQYSFFYNRTVYRYGFRIKQNEIELEWLFRLEKNDEEVEIFVREGQNVHIPSESPIRSLRIKVQRMQSKQDEIFRPDALFLTSTALEGNKLTAGIRNAIASIVVIDGVNDHQARLYGYFKLDRQGPEEKEELIRFIRGIDTGIDELFLSDEAESNIESFGQGKIETPSQPGEKNQQLYSVHTRFNQQNEAVDKITVPFEEWESEGTKKILALGAFILDKLKHGGLLVIDEFDARLHPNLALYLVKKFQGKETNPNKAQLIVATHDTGLMRRAQLRRDQIVIVQKDKTGASSLRTLIEYKGVRKDSSYEKEYLEGRYAGIPYLEEYLFESHM